MDYPILVLVLSLVPMLIAAWLGDRVRNRRGVADAQRDDMKMVLNAVLILLALLIGFTFSMAVSRYDQRKKLEEEEANAIGTEYLRTELLSAENAAKIQGLLKKYVDQRILFYAAGDSEKAAKVRTGSGDVQQQLWAAILAEKADDKPATSVLVLSGMNDVINSEGYTQAAYLDRIPTAAWGLMAAIAIYSNLLIGYSESRTDTRALLVFPIVVAIALFLIAEIDSPHGGMIRVVPYNLVSLSQSMTPK
ncbi:MAG TPA: hypothetical protein VKB38_15075 [Terracidiphilus sp.]|nr:hypothetical protein [Terracidiphilus sp.]